MVSSTVDAGESWTDSLVFPELAVGDEISIEGLGVTGKSVLSTGVDSTLKSGVGETCAVPDDSATGVEDSVGLLNTVSSTLSTGEAIGLSGELSCTDESTTPESTGDTTGDGSSGVELSTGIDDSAGERPELSAGETSTVDDSSGEGVTGTDDSATGIELSPEDNSTSELSTGL